MLVAAHTVEHRDERGDNPRMTMRQADKSRACFRRRPICHPPERPESDRADTAEIRRQDITTSSQSFLFPELPRRHVIVST